MLRLSHSMEDCYICTIRKPFYNKEITLQAMIIKAITNDFDRFIYEYNSPTSRIPKHYFEFLQKMYAHEILKTLLASENLKLEYLDFVINRHLREIDLYCLPDMCDVGPIKQRIIAVGNELTKFSVMGALNFHRLKSVLCYLPSVKELELEYTGFTDETLKIIAENCPLLTSLNVYASYVTDEGMKYLCYPEKHKLALESLNILRTRVTDSGVLIILKDMPTIQHIAHENLARSVYNGAKKNVFSKNGILNLIDIEIYCSKTELKVCSELCPNIRYLFVKSIETQEQLSYCCAFSKLEKVIMTHNISKVPSVCVNPFLEVRGSRIHTLRLNNFVLSVDILIRCCPNLNILELHDPVFLNFSEENVSLLKFERLSFLRIFGCSLLSKEDIESPALIINCSPKLESLAVQCCFIGPLMEDAILNCPVSLVHLDFTDSLVNLNFLQEILLRHRSLYKLIIENSGIRCSEFHTLFDLTDHLMHPVNIIWN